MSKDSQPQKTLRLAFGALCAPLKEQLQSQGIKLPADFVKKQQGDADALVRLLISGILPDSAIAKGRKAILKKIQKAATPKKTPKSRKA
jgi:hypothetical protein